MTGNEGCNGQLFRSQGRAGTDPSHRNESAKLDAAREAEVGTVMASVPAAQSEIRTPRKASARANSTFILAVDTPPMEARAAEVIPCGGERWQYEPKWDGFRCLAFKSGDTIELRAKSGKPIGRYFPEVTSLLRRLSAPQFVVDGELVIEIEGRLAFDALQMRIHPAETRIRKLSVETPARLILFDMLAGTDGRKLIDEPLAQRREALKAFLAQASVPKKLVLSPVTCNRQKTEEWLSDAGHGATDGVVAKRMDDPYKPGERTMIKVKRLRTADCVIGGFRYGTNSRQVGSLLLGLYDEQGKLDHVGFTCTITNEERHSATGARITWWLRMPQPLISLHGIWHIDALTCITWNLRIEFWARPLVIPMAMWHIEFCGNKRSLEMTEMKPDDRRISEVIPLTQVGDPEDYGAPVIYADAVGSWGVLSGVIYLDLVSLVYRTAPNKKSDNRTHVTVHLRIAQNGAPNIIDALNHSLAALAPAQNVETN